MLACRKNTLSTATSKMETESTWTIEQNENRQTFMLYEQCNTLKAATGSVAHKPCNTLEMSIISTPIDVVVRLRTAIKSGFTLSWQRVQRSCNPKRKTTNTESTETTIQKSQLMCNVKPVSAWTSLKNQRIRSERSPKKVNCFAKLTKESENDNRLVTEHVTNSQTISNFAIRDSPAIEGT